MNTGGYLLCCIRSSFRMKVRIKISKATYIPAKMQYENHCIRNNGITIADHHDANQCRGSGDLIAQGEARAVKLEEKRENWKRYETIPGD